MFKSFRFKRYLKGRSFDYTLVVFTFIISLVISIMVVSQREQYVSELYVSRFENSADELKKYLGLPVKINNVLGIHEALRNSFLADQSIFVKVYDQEVTLSFQHPQNAGTECGGFLNSKDIMFSGENVGSLVYCYEKSSQIFWHHLLKGLSGFVFTWILLFFVIGIWYRRRTLIFEKFFRFVDDLNLETYSSKPPDFRDPKVNLAAAKILNLAQRFKNQQDRLLELQRSSEYAKIASQVSHDIRSPLSALNMILFHLDKLDEEIRVLIRSSVNRINDIANSLLTQSKKHQNLRRIQNVTSLTDKVLVSSITDSLISEKRIQYHEYEGLILQAHLCQSYGLFTKINPVEFKRALSNLINNAIESLPETAGHVDVLIDQKDEEIRIIIRDDGIGIPEDILRKLRVKGESFGKKMSSESGTGLGISHARQTLEAAGGRLEIQSQTSAGTEVTMWLKKQTPPVWFVERLNISRSQTIIALDDDNSVLQVWKQKFSNIIHQNQIDLITFSNPEKLREWIRMNEDEKYSAFFLLDYELLGSTCTGLDLIEEFRLNENSILVTSRYEESAIRKRCEALGVKLLPKDMASLMPVQMRDNANSFKVEKA